jgi:hypothetical protein
MKAYALGWKETGEILEEERREPELLDQLEALRARLGRTIPDGRRP